MINGNAPKITKPVGAVRCTDRVLVPSLHGFSHVGARHAAARSRDLHERFVSSAVHRPCDRRRRAVAHWLCAVHGRAGVIERWAGGRER